jgi:hypothetical protein
LYYSSNFAPSYTTTILKRTIDTRINGCHFSNWTKTLLQNLNYKSILSNDVDVSIRTTTRMTRNADPVNGILLNVSRCRTVSYKNNFNVRAPSVWNILPSNIRDTSRSLAYFKNSLFNYYLNLLEQIYNPDNPRTFKSVCVKCHSTRSLDSLLVRTCCWHFSIICFNVYTL